MKSGRNPDDVYQELSDMGISDISMEVMGNAQEMLDEGLRLSDKFGSVSTIKVPCTRDGLAACRELTKERIRTNVTLVFSAAQAVLAAKSGATYVSPFVGRLDDQSVAESLRLYDPSLDFIKFMVSKLKSSLHLFVVFRGLFVLGIMALTLSPCHPRFLSRCTTMCLLIKEWKFLKRIGSQYKNEIYNLFEGWMPILHQDSTSNAVG